MTTDLSHYRFVAKALLNKGARPRELARTMPAHPLSYMELPLDPEYTLYNSRLTPEKLDTATEVEAQGGRRLTPCAMIPTSSDQV